MSISVRVAAITTLALVSGGGCGRAGVESLEVSSAAFKAGERIPVAHTCDGENISPSLSWSALPDNTVSVAVIMDDPDARRWVHWVLFDLPADTRGLPEGITTGAAGLAGGVHGRGNAAPGYFGPCPPEHQGRHRYSFRVYALDSRLGLPDGSIKAEVDAAMRDHILARGELIGVYERP